MSVDQCPSCRAPVRDGRAGCQALYDEIAVKAMNDLNYASVRDLALDAYCMQHLETYCKSAKSYAAHLTRLCCGVEYGGDPKIYASIQRWLNGKVALQKPETLSYIGNITIVDVIAAPSSKEHIRLVKEWAQNVWEAYQPQHTLARTWIKVALER